eukprot:scaffold353631_cov14-Prasinocladus_malaysianus.AAC.1
MQRIGEFIRKLSVCCCLCSACVAGNMCVGWFLLDGIEGQNFADQIDGLKTACYYIYEFMRSMAATGVPSMSDLD